MILRVSIGLTVCAIVLTACGSPATPQAESATGAAPSLPAESPPALACKRRSQMILDHFGVGKSAGSPEEAAAPYLPPGSQLVIEENGDGATLFVTSADGDETLAVIGASNIGGWRIDTIESCLGYTPNIAKR